MTAGQYNEGERKRAAKGQMERKTEQENKNKMVVRLS